MARLSVLFPNKRNTALFPMLAPLLLMIFCIGCADSPVRLATPVTPPVAPTLRGTAQSHNLIMGSAADASHLDEQLYAAMLSTEYSQLQAENEMKFASIHPEPDTYDYTEADALVAFALKNSMKVRGHTLVWHQQVPAWVTEPATPWTTTTLNQVLKDHIANVVGHYQGQVYAWDVVNEAFNDDGTMRSSIWYDSPGIGFAGQGTKGIEQALQWAHAADPAAKLFYNDYGAETINAKSDAIYAMAQDFVKRGVPISGIGLQLHIDPSFDNPATLASLSQNIQRLGALGLEVHFTEVDVRLASNSADNLQLQAKTYADLLTICLQQSSCKVFQTWGFTDRYSWIPSFYPGFGWALPFDEAYAKKPAYQALIKSLQ
jgi:endo-1,4-beta-xylanase